jgi:hypothetical protein
VSETLLHLRFHWSDQYDIGKTPGGQYVAVARFGKQDTLTADDPASCKHMIWQHYPRPSERSST